MLLWSWSCYSTVPIRQIFEWQFINMLSKISIHRFQEAMFPDGMMSCFNLECKKKSLLSFYKSSSLTVSFGPISCSLGFVEKYLCPPWHRNESNVLCTRFLQGRCWWFSIRMRVGVLERQIKYTLEDLGKTMFSVTPLTISDDLKFIICWLYVLIEWSANTCMPFFKSCLCK